MVQLNIVLWWPLNQRCLGNCNIECQFLDHLVHIETCILPFHNLHCEAKILLFQVGQWLRVVLLFLVATPIESDQNSKSWTSLELSCWWKNILHQLRLVVYPIIYKVLAPSQVVGDGISSINRIFARDLVSSWLNCSKSQQMLHIQMVPRHRVKPAWQWEVTWWVKWQACGQDFMEVDSKWQSWYPNLRSLDLSNGHLTIPKKVAKTCQDIIIKTIIFQIHLVSLSAWWCLTHPPVAPSDLNWSCVKATTQGEIVVPKFLAPKGPKGTYSQALHGWGCDPLG